MARNTLVTLLTDFGTRDPYVAAIKGVILSRCRYAQIVDISHDLPPGDIPAAAFVLAQACTTFPPDTLHVVVVDPGVGTQRRILAGQFGGQLFLFPDNGVITFVAQAMPMEALHTVRNTQYVPAAGVSMTFHGRDIFAPVAAEILGGLEIRRLGPTPQAYKLLDLPLPRQADGRLVGQVVYVDRFGNLISNISQRMLTGPLGELDLLEISCGGRTVGPLIGTYGFGSPGQALALINSMGLVEVAVNQGRACDVLQLGVGAEVAVGMIGTPAKASANGS